MIRRFLVEHREWAGRRFREANDRSNAALLDRLTDRSAAVVAAHEAAVRDELRARRSLARADVLLDLWTFGGRR